MYEACLKSKDTKTLTLFTILIYKLLIDSCLDKYIFTFWNKHCHFSTTWNQLLYFQAKEICRQAFEPHYDFIIHSPSSSKVFSGQMLLQVMKQVKVNRQKFQSIPFPTVEQCRDEACQALCISQYAAVSYTHLDVYKIQVQTGHNFKQGYNEHRKPQYKYKRSNLYTRGTTRNINAHINTRAILKVSSDRVLKKSTHLKLCFYIVFVILETLFIARHQMLYTFAIEISCLWFEPCTNSTIIH